jgi:UTP--glucose-1-phosphate uridylyltransferase
VPKELAPIVTTPALEFVVAEASRNGITDVLLVLSEDKTSIADYFAPNPDLEEALAAKGDTEGLASIRRAGSFARIAQVLQKEPRGLGDAVAHGEDFAAGEPIGVLLPDDLIDDRDELLGTMLDVYAEFGGVVIGLIDVPRGEIDKYGCIAPAEGADLEGDVVRTGTEHVGDHRSLRRTAGDIRRAAGDRPRRRGRDPAHRRHSAAGE